MSRMSRGEGQQKFAQTGAGTNAGVTVSQTAPGAGSKLIVTKVTVSGDAAALVTIESPAGQVIWQKRYAAAFADEQLFNYGELESGDNTLVQVKISASTSHCEANIAGLVGPNNA